MSNMEQGRLALARADADIGEDEQQIAVIRSKVNRLTASGRDMTVALDLLATMQDALELQIRCRALILSALGEHGDTFH